MLSSIGGENIMYVSVRTIILLKYNELRNLLLLSVYYNL